ncbi:hypothetical protein [Halobacterium litoreum]|uniref:Uncharacterized protein n=1 Tax=Halobacterium litoreum TaxID=2039234 RepID=A0ABD5NIL7_9EURY|nr:hypothetical protein [Halobacterium litoreum]UHH12161.1 hypothetical protein LT972_08330 [Halobacterium litoreum]
MNQNIAANTTPAAANPTAVDQRRFALTMRRGVVETGDVRHARRSGGDASALSGYV